MTQGFSIVHDPAVAIGRSSLTAALDSRPKTAIDSITEAASAVCAAPYALLGWVDGEQPVVASRVGLPARAETSWSAAFCLQTIRCGEVMEVADARCDPRFADNPLVTGESQIRFYAGAPVALADGLRFGALCIMDTEPRKLSSQQRNALAKLAAVAAQMIELQERADRAVRDLGLSERRLDNLYSKVPTMLHSVDAQGRLLSVSDEWVSRMGYRREEVLGHRAQEFLTPASQADAVQTVQPQMASTGRCDDMELQLIRKDGRVIDAMMSAILELDASGRPIRTLAVTKDLTLIKQAERALKTSEVNYRRIFELSPVGILANRLSDGQFLYGNAALYASSGYTAEEFSQLSFRDVTVPQYYFREQDTFQDLKALGRYGPFEMEFVRKDGTRYPVLLEGVRTIGAERAELIVSSVQDISARKQADELLRANQSFLKRTGEVAGVGGWEFDLASEVITWSEQTCRMHDVEPGYRPTQAEAVDFYAEEAKPLFLRAMDEALKFGKSWDLELPFVSAKGRPFWARAVGAVEIEGGKPVRLVGAFQDVSQRKALEKRLAEEHELLRVTLDSIGDAVITTDCNGLVQWLNPVAERMTGWGRSEAQGKLLKRIFVIVDEQTRKPSDEPVAICLAEGKVVGDANHTVLISRDGTEYGIEDSAAPIRDPSGDLLGAVLVFHDVSEQRRLSNEMNYRARHDSLTGLINRGEFESRLDLLLHKSRRDEGQNALLFVDLDQFKLVNDACGHTIGDELLRQVAALLQSCVRGPDTVARLGGDEFAIILERCNTGQAQQVAQKICDQMEGFRFIHEGRRFRVGTSIGLVPIDDRWMNTATLLQAADTACYAAKEAGRNRVHLWFDTDHAMKARLGQMQWVSRLEQAMDENRFELFAQRILALGEDGTGLHCEILLRLREADGSIVLPGAFFQAAERFHMATRIDRWVVRNVFDWLADPKTPVEKLQMVAINLSGQSIGDRAFHRDVIERVALAKFDVGKLCFEITETAAITNLGDAKIFVAEMRRFGVKIALDDFGAGASSFAYLKTIPVDFLKIDGQFITGLLDDKLDNAAVRCFHDVAQAIGVRTIAEFVEREDILLALRGIGIDFAQGHLIHRAEPLADLMKSAF